MNNIILIGGGGHCISCIDVIESTHNYEIQGILDIPEKIGEKVLEYPIFGTESDISKYIEKNTCFLITIGQIKTASLRKRIYSQLLALNAALASIISAHAYMSEYAQLGQGSIVMHKACVNACAVIGNNVIINSGAIVEHGVHIGDHCHISTSAVINGDCRIGNDVFIGSGAIIKQGISIPDSSIIAAGAVVLQSINEAGLYAGIPARKKI